LVFTIRRNRYWLLYTPPEIVEETLREKIQDFCLRAKLEKYNIDSLNDLNSPIVLNYSFSGQDYFTSAGSVRILPQLVDVDTALTAKVMRNYPIDFDILDAKRRIMKFLFRKNFSK